VEKHAIFSTLDPLATIQLIYLGLKAFLSVLQYLTWFLDGHYLLIENTEALNLNA